MMIDVGGRGSYFYYDNDIGKEFLTAFASSASNSLRRRLFECVQYIASRSVSSYRVQSLVSLKKYFDVPVIHYDLSLRYSESGAIVRAVTHHFKYALAQYEAEGCFYGPTFFDNEVKRSCGDARRILRAFIDNVVPRKTAKRFVQNVVEPFYSGFLRAELLDSRMYQEMLDVSAYLCSMLDLNA